MQISDQKQQSQVKFNLQQEEIFLKYTGETSSETSSIETAKLLINSTLMTKGSKFMAIDISNFYIQNDLEDYKYIYFAMNMILQDIVDEYNLKEIVCKDGYCYAEIRKAVYGLCEAGYIAKVKLKRVLGLEGYVLSKFTPGLFTHKTRDIVFSLVVDDFDVRCIQNKERRFGTSTKDYTR